MKRIQIIESFSTFYQIVKPKWYNSKYCRSGHLFQDRFHSNVIEDKAHYLSALVYIHNNPVKANLCKYQSDYRWSSYNAFYGQKNPLINLPFSYDIAGSKDLLLKYFSIQSGCESNEYFQDDHPDVTHFLTDAQALRIFKKVTKLSSTSDAQFLPKKIRNEYIVLLKKQRLTQKLTLILS